MLQLLSEIMTFQIVVAIIAVYLLTFDVVLYFRWRKHLGHKSWFRLVSIAYIAFVAFTQLPLWAWVIGGRKAMQFEITGILEPIYFIYLSWQYTLLGFFPLYLTILLISSVVGWVYLFASRRSTRGSDSPPSQETVKTPAELSRRDLFKKVGTIALDAAPAVLTVSAFTGMFMGSREITVDNVPIKIKNLHPDLEGARIVQLSDTHIGNLINESYLHFARDIIEPLKADYVFVTGDIIDNNNYYLKDAGPFFARLAEKHQLFGILGNHDFIMNGDEVAQVLGQAGLKILRNESMVLKRGRGKINLAGLDYPYPFVRQRGARLKTSQQYFNQAKSQFKEDLPTILLNHHPEDYRYLQDEKVDLVLSGHTHGGQFRFSKNRESIFSVGSIGYKYYIGHYQEKGTQLYVNRGLGHWFPLRVGCPAEITLIELQRA